MSLAAVPVYLWARTLVPRRSALTAAALTLATPVLAYSGLVMTEVLFYPLLVTPRGPARRRSRGRRAHNQLLLLAAFVAVCATRIQAIVLVPALVTAALLDAWLARSWAALRRQLPAAVGLGVLAGRVGGLAARVRAGGARRLRRRRQHVVQRRRGGPLRPLPRRVAADPLRPVPGRRRRRSSSSRRCAGASTTSACAPTWRSRPRSRVWVVVEVGVFASRYSDRIVERNLIGLAPVLFIGLVLWLERGPDGGYVVRGRSRPALAVLLRPAGPPRT